MATLTENGSGRWQDRPAIRRVLLALAVIGFVNFCVYAIVAVLIGGNSWSGQEADGGFFVGMYGELTKVSHGVYAYSYWHTISVFITFPLCVLACVLLRVRNAPLLHGRDN